MNQIVDTIMMLWKSSSKTKQSSSGWISGNAVCCHHRGESKDNRYRGGILINPNGGFTWHCFNCNFKAGWSPGHLLSKNTKNLFKWLGLSDTDIDKLSFIALQNKQDQPKNKRIIRFDIEERSLPEGTMSVMNWINTAYLPDIAVDLGKIIEYILGRGMELEWYNWMWSPAPGYKDRVMIPFYQDGKVVGYTGRKITEGKPKYLTDAQPGYVFNIDHQTYERKYIIVVEGQFDAIAIDGIAVMHNEPNETQCARINALGKEVIVVPDRDKPGAKMIQAALNNNWSVSLPPWEDHIKDTADAVKHYGRLYTLFTILHYRETNEIKIQLLKKKLEALNG
jgi:5S rRNA maturation endonuclease (ribonuclease M5)